MPEDIGRAFTTERDIAPEWHIRMQAMFQKYADNSLSKTINLPKAATRDDIRNIYRMAHELKCKGITVYRYGSKKQQVLMLPANMSRQNEDAPPYLTVDSEHAGACPF